MKRQRNRGCLLFLLAVIKLKPYLNHENAVNTAKNNVQSLLNKLPDDCSYEDIQYHLYVVEKIKKGIERAEVEDAISQEDVEKRLDKWLTK